MLILRGRDKLENDFCVMPTFKIVGSQENNTEYVWLFDKEISEKNIESLEDFGEALQYGFPEEDRCKVCLDPKDGLVMTGVPNPLTGRYRVITPITRNENGSMKKYEYRELAEEIRKGLNLPCIGKKVLPCINFSGPAKFMSRALRQSVSSSASCA